MAAQSTFLRMSNPFMKALLRSPMHGVLSRNYMLITVTGRKSGKSYTTTVNFLRHGELLEVVSLRERTWWRNLRSGAPVTLRLQGKVVPGWGTVIEAEQEVAEALAAYLQLAPKVAKYMGVTLDSGGQPRQADTLLAARTRVMVEVKLS